MIKTEFFDDFVEYYRKAEMLQNRNRGITKSLSGDPIMDNVTIYDTVNRRFAGFSKALEDVHGTRESAFLKKYKDFSGRLTLAEFHFVHLVHRFTGSGASFQPTILPDGTRNPDEHGYKNNHVEELCKLQGINHMIDYLVKCEKPMVTSTGNQPPSMKNGNPNKYRLAQQYYYDNFARDFITDYIEFLTKSDYIAGIKDGVDFACSWHKNKGFKQWHFVLTAFVMDTAEYYPKLIDPDSHCYYGANCIRSMDLCFIKEKSDKERGNDWYEKCMEETCKVVKGRPYDIEDIFCDFIRYIKEYIPKGYDHLIPWQRRNNSTLKVNHEYPESVKKRIIEVIGE